MTRDFKVVTEVSEVYELGVQRKIEIHDWQSCVRWETRKETKTFADFASACTWVRDNPDVPILSFALVTNKLDELLDQVKNDD